MFEMQTITLSPSYLCNLNCKHCGCEVPYLKKIVSHSVEEMMDMCSRMFKIADHVQHVGISGGEPLLYKDLPLLINELTRFIDHFDSINIVTNGTLVPNEELISAIDNLGKKFDRVYIDDYGVDLSKKVPEIIKVLENNQIEYRVNDYWSENMRFGGWTDMGSCREDLHTPEEAAELLGKCVYPSQEFCYIMHGGILDPCGKIYTRIDAGLKVDPEEYIDLYDDSLGVEQQREKITRINNAKYLEMCRHCNGLYPGCKRIKPAEQLTPEELQQIKEKLNET